MRHTDSFEERAFDFDLIRTLAEKYRFELAGLYDDYTDEPLCDTSQRAVFVFKKHGTQFEG